MTLIAADSGSFSAPLTPTVRRYLNLPAGGGPVKAKAKAAAPARPAPVASSSHAPNPLPPVKVQHHRVAALVTKPAPPPIKPVATLPVAPSFDHQAGPSRPRRSPVKAAMTTSYDPRTPPPRDRVPAPVVQQNLPARYDAAPQQAKAYPMLSRRPEAKPLAAAGRSVSHNVLPTEAYSTHTKIDLNPLAKPGRPELVQSYSTTALPDARPHPLPLSKPGRFATGPMRIVRPAPMMSTDGQDGEQATMNVDGFFYTPSGATVLRGPVRPPPTIGHNRRPIGQAQRRVVTAPGVTGEITIGKTPAMRRVLTRNIHEKIGEGDERATSESPAKPNESLQPIQNPTPASFPDPSSSEMTAQPDVEGDVAQVETPPLDDVDDDAILAKAQDRVRLSLALLDETPVTVPAEIAAQIPLPIESPQKQTTLSESAPTLPIEKNPGELLKREIDVSVHEEAEREKETVSDQEIPAMVVMKASSRDEEKIDLETPKMVRSGASEALSQPSQPAMVIEQPEPTVDAVSSVVEELVPAAVVQVTGADDVHSEPTQVSEKPRVEPAPPAAATTSTASTKPRLEPRSPPARSATSRTVSGRSDKQTTTETSNPTTAPLPPRKPPVPRAAAVTRIARPVDRKPFRPTTAAESAAARVVSAVSGAKAVTRPTVTQTTKAIVVTKPAEGGVRARIPSASATSTVSTDSRPPQATRAEPAAARPTKPSTLHAPTKASASRAAPIVGQPTQRIISTGSNTASTHLTSTSTALPPVRKERIKLKAALPSFRPVRQGQGTLASASGAGQVKSTSTSSSVIASQGRAGGARVKPESIPLPNSPASKNITNAPSSETLPTSTSSSQGSGRARVRPESIPQHSSPQITQASTLPNIASQLSAAHSSPVRAEPEHIPLPPTPVSTPHTQALPRLTPTPGEDTAAHSGPVPRLNELGLPLPIARDRFESSRSKASDAPTASVSGSDSDAETDDEVDDLEGVTFKPQHQYHQSASNVMTAHAVSGASGAGANGRPQSRTRVVSADSENTITLSHTPQSQKGYPVDTSTTPSRKALVFRDANVGTQAVPAAPTIPHTAGTDEVVNA